MSQIARRQCFLCHNLLFFVIQYEKLSFPYLIVAPLTAERHVPYRKLRDAADSNQRVSRFCEPLPTAVIPIQAEAASLVEGSCVPSVARPEVERDIPFIFALAFVFYTKGTVPFVLLPHVLHCRSIRWRVNCLFLHCRSPQHCSDWGERGGGRCRPRRGFRGRPPWLCFTADRLAGWSGDSYRHRSRNTPR